MRFLSVLPAVLLVLSCGGKQPSIDPDPVKEAFQPFLIGMDFGQAVKSAGVNVDTTPVEYPVNGSLSVSTDPSDLPKIFVAGGRRSLMMVGSIAGKAATVLHVSEGESSDAIYCVDRESVSRVKTALSAIFGNPMAGRKNDSWMTLTYTIFALDYEKSETDPFLLDHVCYVAGMTEGMGALPGDPRREPAVFTMADLRTLGLCIEQYAIDNAIYPVAENFSALRKLIIPQCPGDVKATDSWGNKIIVLSSSGCYIVVSPGRDGRFEDDYSSYRLPDVKHFRECEDFIANRIPSSGSQSSYDFDIVYAAGRFYSWPQGIPLPK